MAVRDTHIPRIHTDVWAEVKPRVESALDAIGVGTGGRVWTRTVPQQRNPGVPYVILDGSQDEAQAFQSFDKYGIGFDVEVRCVSGSLTQAEKLASEVKTRVTDIQDPPEPDGLSHRYTRDRADVSGEALSGSQGDLFEILVRTRLFYQTTN
jgi:hypothetical protein